MCRANTYIGKLWKDDVREISSRVGEYFPFVESEGIDRRHTILEISTEEFENGGHVGEVFDTLTGQIVWKSRIAQEEDEALEQAESILQQLETIHGFGSISLRGDNFP